MAEEQGQTALREVTFGSMAGMVAKLFEHPFDLVKVRLQSQPTDRPATFAGPLDCFKQTYGKEGWRGLYRGISAPIVGAAMENATLFLVYEKCQRAILYFSPFDNSLGKKQEFSTPQLALAGAGAGAVTSFVLTPVELVKCRMQVQMLAREGAFAGLPTAEPIANLGTGAMTTAKRSLHTSPVLRQLHTPSPTLPPLQGPFEIITTTLRSQGIRGLWLGQLGTLFRETGGGSAWFTAYEVVSRSFLARAQAQTGDTTLTKSDLKTWQLMLSGAAAGVSYNVILFPADSIKSAIQTQAELDPHAPRLSFAGMGKKIWSTRGIKGLYAGCGVTCLRSGPSSAMIFALYETLQGKFGYLFD
ncbi:mitochondrial carrier domain-containing protein [Papiliotrema laurentii]|uniref:Mitochondrial carrier domain-containing protein n=1 Tax=Papiliotrema laurentii TaxID=5418 RepID=A0AAD9CTF4_PAPLA|nr:mitochondrial carrier domain-containing protein [Papiliotrema laurentii]